MSNFKPVREPDVQASCRCLRCGWEWVPRKPGIPATCPHPDCRSPHWQTPKIIKKKKKKGGWRA